MSAGSKSSFWYRADLLRRSAGLVDQVRPSLLRRPQVCSLSFQVRLSVKSAAPEAGHCVQIGWTRSQPFGSLHRSALHCGPGKGPLSFLSCASTYSPFGLALPKPRSELCAAWLMSHGSRRR